MPKKRKSTLILDKRGFNYYQTMSFQDTIGNKKKRVMRYLGKNMTKSELTSRKKELDKHYDYIDTNTIKGNPQMKNPNTLDVPIASFGGILFLTKKIYLPSFQS